MSNELTAAFRDAAGDGVLSDGIGGYVSAASRAGWDRVQFERTYGKIIINLRTSSPAGRYLNLRFEEMLRSYLVVEPGGDGFDCRDYFGTQMNVPEFPMPPLPLPGSTTTTSFLIETMARVTYNTETAKWESTGTTFNVRDDMGVMDTVYVGLNFYVSAAGRNFWLAFNERQFGGLDLRMVPGFAQVTRSGQNTWVLRPIDPVYSPPLPNNTEETFANLTVHVPEVKKVHGAGYCDLGDWRMPFSITLTRY